MDSSPGSHCSGPWSLYQDVCLGELSSTKGMEGLFSGTSQSTINGLHPPAAQERGCSLPRGDTRGLLC